MALPVFPTLPGITFPVRRGASWQVAAQDSLSGKRVRTSYYSYPIYMWEVTFNFLRTASAFLEWQQLAGFINALQGSAGVFLYSDPNDNSATSQVFGLGDGTTTTFQLVRSLGSFVEPVFASNIITAIDVNGVPTAAYTLGTTGSVIFNTAPPAGQSVSWTGSFYWVCRFDNGQFDFDNFVSQIFELKSLKFSSEKLV